MKILISALLIIHGLIVAGQSAGSFGSTIPSELQNPSFVSWWPINLGRSWLFSWFHLERTLAVYRVGGLLWLVGGIALVAAGLGVLGFMVPPDWWRGLAVAGGAISLFMLALYFHPLSILGFASSVAILVALLWLRWPPTSLIP
jgi:hypothetical protein